MEHPPWTLRETYTLDGPPAGGECVLTLIPLPRKPIAVGQQKLVIDRPPLGFRGLARSCISVLRSFPNHMATDVRGHREQLVPHMASGRRQGPTIVVQEQRHDPSAVPFIPVDRDPP